MPIFKNTIIASLVMGAVSTLGDFIWEIWVPTHKAIFGMIHGALLCLFMGFVLGWFAKTQGALIRGGIGELSVGLFSAGSFYLIAPFAGMSAMFISWMLLWLLTGFLNRWITDSNDSVSRTFARGSAAAVFSGLAFYAISDIWLNPPVDGPNYLVNFLFWSFAFLPGFIFLFFELGPQKPERD